MFKRNMSKARNGRVRGHQRLFSGACVLLVGLVCLSFGMGMAGCSPAQTTGGPTQETADDTSQQTSEPETAAIRNGYYILPDSGGYCRSYHFYDDDGTQMVEIGKVSRESISSGGGIADFDYLISGEVVQDGSNERGPIWRVENAEFKDEPKGVADTVRFQIPEAAAEGELTGTWVFERTYDNGTSDDGRVTFDAPRVEICEFDSDGGAQFAYGFSDNALDDGLSCSEFIDDATNVYKNYNADAYWNGGNGDVFVPSKGSWSRLSSDDGGAEFEIVIQRVADTDEALISYADDE